MSPARCADRAAGAGRQGGFTLIELLVVLAVMAFGAMFVMPLLLNRSDTVGVDRVVSDVAQQVRGLRGRAMTENRLVRVAPDMLEVPGAATVTMPAGGIDFSADGFSGGGRIVIAVGEARGAVVVEPVTGRIRRE